MSDEHKDPPDHLDPVTVQQVAMRAYARIRSQPQAPGATEILRDLDALAGDAHDTVVFNRHNRHAAASRSPLYPGPIMRIPVPSWWREEYRDDPLLCALAQYGAPAGRALASVIDAYRSLRGIVMGMALRQPPEPIQFVAPAPEGSHTKAFGEYVDLAFSLHRLLVDGKVNTAEADALRERMNVPEEQLTQEQRIIASALTAACDQARQESQTRDLLRRYGFLVGNPLRTDEEEQEMHNLQERLASHGLDPGWKAVERRERPRFPGRGWSDAEVIDAVRAAGGVNVSSFFYALSRGAWTPERTHALWVAMGRPELPPLTMDATGIAKVEREQHAKEGTPT